MRRSGKEHSERGAIGRAARMARVVLGGVEMVNWKRIVVPIDFGDSADAAIDLAITLARKFDASLIAVNAWEVPAYAYPADPMLPIADLGSVIGSSSETALREAVARLKGRWPGVTGLLRQGAAWREVLDVAAERSADLIVMGTHGRRGLAHAVLGSVAEKVVRFSPVPVITVRAHTPPRPTRVPQRILVATDFSEPAKAALEYAIDLAKATEAQITLLHAYELPVAGFPDGTLVVSAELAARIGTAASDALAPAAGAHDGCGVEIGRMLKDDVAWRAVSAAADEVDADLIVVGTHGRTGLAHAFLGSVAEKIVRTASRPVLTIGPRRPH